MSLLYSVGKRNVQQIEMDRCTGHFAIQLRAATLSMERSYERVRNFGIAYKAACATIVACPHATSIANQYVSLEKAIQTAVKKYWDLKTKEWEDPSMIICNTSRMMNRSRFPDFPYRIITGTIADLTEDLVVNLPKVRNQVLELELFNYRLKSNAQLKFTGAHKNEWDISWTK